MLNIFLPILAAIFVYLKLTATTVVATWSWFWVLSPVILPAILALGFITLLLVICLITGTKPTIKYGRK